MKLSDIGEFQLIDRLSKIIGKAKKPVVLGIGDDCAVIETANNKYQTSNNSKGPMYQLITTDTLVENVHFKLPKGTANSFAGSFKLGMKAMIANVSDISAMGGVPTYAVVTLGAPKNFKVESAEAILKGMLKIARKHGVQIVGGDTVRSRDLVISVTLLGEVEKKYLLTRSGAKVGDIICVTGSFGHPASANYLLHITDYCPQGRLIAKKRIATAMIDSSDGLVESIRQICKASQVDARIDFDQVPIAKGATLEQALFGGEEYELVFTVPKSKAKKLDYRVVGQIVKKGQGNLPKGGFKHF